MNEWIRGTILACVACLLIFAFAAFGIPYAEYCQAVSLQKDGQIIEAYDAFIAMDGYRDSAERAAALYEQYKVEKFKAAKVGDYIYFGTYEQDNDLANGPEDIQWRVLAIVDGKALVISRYGLSCRQYHEWDEDVTWENCTLRAWLNTEFWNDAFSDQEKKRIPTVTVPVDRNSVNKQDQGDPTEDRLFILSRSELETYMGNMDLRRSQATKWAIAQGTLVSDYTEKGWWWTRTSGRYSNEVLTVDSYGEIGNFGDNVADTYYAVRPAMWVDLGELDD